ncbi:MAG: CRTAC1 family protein [Kordiimonadaceae bacterium]|nr:CRTAC1 family protein [Kordiimonadaceae bacterium]
MVRTITNSCVISVAITIYALCSIDCDAQKRAPVFNTVQPETFADNMALSNAWGDFDNDGDLDLAISFKTGDVRLYENNEGSFKNIGPKVGLPTEGKETRSVAWGDYNGDGYLDLYVGSNRNGNELYRNDQGKGFSEVGVSLGVDIPHVSTRQINWIDYDNNGTVDLFVADRVGANYLFQNDNGVFVNVSKEVGLADERPTVGACWFDYNKDGFLDLFMANQSGTTDAFYKNEGGIFTDIAPELGMEGDKRRNDQGGVDCAVGDYDNDGDFDLFVANYGRNYLYENNGSGGFSEVSEKMGIRGDNHMVGASWGDYDNDGWLDLYVAGYKGPAENRIPVDRLFHNEGDRFSEVNTVGTPLSGADHGIQWADFDQDGDLDLSLTEGYNIKGHHPLLKNELPPERAESSLQIEVLDEKGLKSRAGAEVRLYDRSSALVGSRLVSTGDGYNSHSSGPVHFGLVDHSPVTVEVTFLTNAGRITQKQENVNPADYAGGVLEIKQVN